MKRLGDITSGTIRDLRRRRNTFRLCRDWPRAMVELIDDIGAKSGRMTEIEQRLDACVRLLDVGAAGAHVDVEFGGCDRSPPIPIHDIVNDDVSPRADSVLVIERSEL